MVALGALSSPPLEHARIREVPPPATGQEVHPTGQPCPTAINGSTARQPALTRVRPSPAPPISPTRRRRQTSATESPSESSRPTAVDNRHPQTPRRRPCVARRLAGG